MKKPLLSVAFLVGSLFLCALLLFATPVNALLITPSTTPSWSGDQHNMKDIRIEITELISPFDPKKPLYKSDVGNDKDEGSFPGSYDTVFYNKPLDPEEATISYTGGPYVDVDHDSPAWLLVVDGDSDPGWYLFDLRALGWNGTEDLVLDNFWPGKGAISNLSIYGTPVPEPATMLLLGTGLIGLAVVGRRKFFKR